MTTQDALLRIAESTAHAAADFLRELTSDQVIVRETDVVIPGRDPLSKVKTPAITASVSYADAMQGGTVMVMPVAAARALAGATGDEGAEKMSEAELSAAGEALAKTLDAVVASTAELLGEEVLVGAPSIQVAETRADMKISFTGATRATVAEMVVFGEPCQLIQLVPTLFTMRMTQAMASRSAAMFDPEGADELRDALRMVPLRVWAELGRASLRSAEAAGLADGAIIELDRAADDPIDIFVNGSRIATGRLVALEDDEWAVRLEHVFPRAHTPPKAA